MKMDQYHKLIYLSYLGKEMPTRLQAIIDFVRTYDGRDLFNNYSTSEDSILSFLSKCDAKGIKI